MNSIRSGFYLKNLLYLRVRALLLDNSCCFSLFLYSNFIGAIFFAFWNARKPIFSFNFCFTIVSRWGQEYRFTFYWIIWLLQIPSIYKVRLLISNLVCNWHKIWLGQSSINVFNKVLKFFCLNKLFLVADPLKFMLLTLHFSIKCLVGVHLTDVEI
jgi:hypothetical protein